MYNFFELYEYIILTRAIRMGEDTSKPFQYLQKVAKQQPPIYQLLIAVIIRPYPQAILKLV